MDDELRKWCEFRDRPDRDPNRLPWNVQPPFTELRVFPDPVYEQANREYARWAAEKRALNLAVKKHFSGDNDGNHRKGKKRRR